MNCTEVGGGSWSRGLNSTPPSSPHRGELDALSRRAARVSQRAAMSSVASVAPSSPHRALQQCRANHLRVGVRQLEGALQQEAELLEQCSSSVREMVRSCGGIAAAEALAAEAANGTHHGARAVQLEDELTVLRKRCTEAEGKLEDEKRRRVEASEALESHAAHMVEHVAEKTASHAEQLERHKTEHAAEVTARQEGWAQAASEHGDEVASMRAEWAQAAQRHTDEVKELRAARDTALAHAKAAEERRDSEAAEMAHQKEAVEQKWSALERTTESVHVALHAVEQAEAARAHAEAAQAQVEAERAEMEAQLGAERRAREHAEALLASTVAAAAEAEQRQAEERVTAEDKARWLKISANALAIQLAGVRKMQMTLRQQVQTLQIAIATSAEPLALAVTEHFTMSAVQHADGVSTAVHAERDAQAADAEEQQLRTMRLLIDAARAEATQVERQRHQQQETQDAPASTTAAAVARSEVS